MEISKRNTLILNNIRQTKEWATYLSHLKWKYFKLSNGSLVYYYSLGFLGAIAKIYRPGVLDEKLFQELDSKCKNHKILFLKFEPSFYQDINLLKKFNFNESNFPLLPSSTGYIDLTQFKNNLWNNLSTSGKYGVNRGEKEKTRVEFYKNPSKEKLLEFYASIYRYTGVLKKFNLYTENEFLQITNDFSPNIFLSLIYDSNDNLCGGKYYLVYENIAYYLFGGTTDIGTTNRSGFVQMWESIKYFKEYGLKILDLDGMYDERYPTFFQSWKGFSQFKMKFGPTIIKYPFSQIKIYNKFMNFILKTMKISF